MIPSNAAVEARRTSGVGATVAFRDRQGTAASGRIWPVPNPSRYVRSLREADEKDSTEAINSITAVDVQDANPGQTSTPIEPENSRQKSTRKMGEGGNRGWSNWRLASISGLPGVPIDGVVKARGSGVCSCSSRTPDPPAARLLTTSADACPLSLALRRPTFSGHRLPHGLR